MRAAVSIAARCCACLVFVEPLISDHRQKLERLKPWYGSQSLKPLCVCLSVCSQATGHSFWPRNLIFWHNTPWDMRKKRNFLFFEILIFGPFRALFRPFSSIFFFILCKSSVRATSHTDRLTNLIFGTESLYVTITWGFHRFLKICISAPFRGPFIFKKGPKSQKT